MKSVKRYEYIIEKRYIISAILIVLSTIVGVIINTKNYPFMECICNTGLHLSLWWNLKFYALLLGTYELFRIITNENKGLSVAGSLIVSCSSLVAYNFTKIDALVFGNIIMVLIDRLLKSEKKKSKVLLAIAIILCSIAYSYTFIPYAISLGYLYIAFTIFILIRNKEKLKENKTSLICTLLISILGMALSKLILKNNYLEEPIEFLSGMNLLYSYLYNVFLPFKNIENKELFASIISVWPVPLIISLYYIYKNEKHIEFLLPITIIGVMQTLYCSAPVPEIIKKILFSDNVAVYRIMLAVHLSNLFILFYFLGNIKEKLFKTKVAIRLSVLFIILLAFVYFPTVIGNRWYLTLYVMEQTALAFLFLNMEEKSYRKVLIVFLVLLTLIGGVPINL